MPGDYRERLYPLCDRLVRTAVDIISGCDLKVTERGMLDPPILAATLLSRTISNFRAACQLVRSRMVVEARVLTRCCYENMFMIGGLHSQGKGFADRMKEDDEAGRSGRLRFARQMELIFESLTDDLKEAVRNRLSDGKPKLQFLQPKAASSASAFKESYLVYSQFSGDAAHPTISALARHWAPGPTGKIGVFDVSPEPSEDELDQTLDFACIALLGGMVAVNEMAGFTEPGRLLPQLNGELQALQQQRWGGEVVEGMTIRTEKQ